MPGLYVKTESGWVPINVTGGLTKSEADELYADKSVESHVSATDNPHGVTKQQVGLGNVPNVDATDRSNHTGTQGIETITGLESFLEELEDDVEAVEQYAIAVSNASFPKQWIQVRVLENAVGPVKWPDSPGWIITGLGLQSAPANSVWWVRWLIGDYISGADEDGVKWEVTGPSGTTVTMVAIGNVGDSPSTIVHSPIVAPDTSTAKEFLTGVASRGYTMIEGVVTLGGVAGSVFPAVRTGSDGEAYLYAKRSTLVAIRLS